MPILKNAQKALRVSKRKNKINQPIKTRVKTMSDKVIKSKSVDDLSNAYSAIDKAVKRNLIHKNKAARLKSKLSRVAVNK